MHFFPASIICWLASSLAYTLFLNMQNYFNHGGFFSFPGPFFLILIFSGIIYLFVMPLLYLMDKENIRSIYAFVILNSVITGSVIAYANTGSIILNPEGFFIGAVTGLLYWALHRSYKPKPEIYHR